MTHSNTILLASDLTARSDRPTDRAFLAAEQLSASVLLVHVVEGEGGDAKIEEHAREALESVIGQVAGRVEIQIRRGRVQHEILEVAAARESILIVTGAARFNSILDYVLGTAVDHLVRHSPVPVLVVKQRAQVPYRKLLVATDFSECAGHALETAAGLFPDAAITVWHNCHSAYEAFLDKDSTQAEIQQQADRDMKRFLESAHLSDGARERVSHIVDLGDLQGRLGSMLKEGRFDLLVLGTHGRSGFAHATIGSRASEMLNAAACDVLMVRGSK
ncbi:universal stress protein [Sphingosinithalassobacter sp. CS137]|uniref:universal stress protein n=1 Tax=Sphingosinithalassobacter sp. CS137 TaxID=2762748 RepID=UPI00165E9F57|nr:universal stress protein [Sphingosinithalassobacter sp. CS137]